MTSYKQTIKQPGLQTPRHQEINMTGCIRADLKLVKALQESITLLEKVSDYKEIVNIVIDGKVETAITGKTFELENLMDTLEDIHEGLTSTDLLGYKYGDLKEIYKDLNDGINNQTMLNFFNEDVMSISTIEDLAFYAIDDSSLLEVNMNLTEAKKLLHGSLGEVHQELYKNYISQY
jgi:hypothetical protein